MNDPIVSVYYNEVAQNQIQLSREEEEDLFRAYGILRRELQSRILEDPRAREALQVLFLNIKGAKKSPAKITSIYNAKIKGRNKKIAKMLDLAYEKNAWDDVPLSLKTCYDIERSVKNPTLIKEIASIREDISQIEHLICRANLMAAISVSRIYASNVFGIDPKDAVQEANRGIIESIERYDPNYITRSGQRVKFLTYAYKNAVKKVKEFIMTQSRLVRLPRTQLERIFLVIEASNMISIPDVEQLTRTSNLILEKRRGGKLSDSEKISKLDVEEAIGLLSGNSISLDQKNTFTHEENSKPKTLGDLIPDEKPNPEEELGKKTARESLLTLLVNFLSEIEYNVIYYKYFNTGDEESLETVQKDLAMFGVELSRERINQIKKNAFEKMQKVPRVRTLLKECL